jgi:uncharacterized membrane protein YhaH (DUF805 family)
MTILIRLFIIIFTLYLYLSLFASNIHDINYSIPNKIYLFVFVFIVQFLLFFFTNTTDESFTINEMITTSMNNALMAVIAFDVYNDLYITRHFDNLSANQLTLMLVFLIIGFMVAFKIILLLMTNN